jgi:L-ascorbate metabolism protein UlaG (beta-lactamase superfamily)
MRKLWLIFALTCAAWAAPSDVLKTSAGDLKITPVTHGSVLLEINGQAWHIDPWSPGDYSALPKADVILITDTHGDHMDPKAIAAIKKDSTVIIAPSSVAKTVTEAKVLANGESTTVSGIKIEAVPMYNLQRGPEAGKFYHDKGRGNGYVLTIGDKRIYFSGDTEAVPEMKALKNIDVAFLCMNLPYTMPPDEAAEGVKAFRPKVVYPYHYRGADLAVFSGALKNEKDIEVRLRDWY